MTAPDLPGITTEPCGRKANATGKPCRRLVRGGGPCWVHGGAAPQVKAAKARRIALAEQLEATDRRHPGEVLLDAVHTSDVLAKNALRDLEDGNLSPRRLKEAVAAIERAATLARAALSADAEGRSVAALEGQARQLGPVLEDFLQRLGLSGDPTAEQALQEAVEAAGLGERTPVGATFAARRVALAEDQGQLVVEVVQRILVGVGLDGDTWARAQVAAGLRGLGAREALGPAVPPPPAWWLAMRQRCDRQLAAVERGLRGSPRPRAIEGRVVDAGMGPL